MRCHRSCAPGRTEPGGCSRAAQRSVRHDPPDIQRPGCREAAVRNRKSGRGEACGSRSLSVSHANRHEGSHFNCVKIIYLPPRAHAGPMLHKHVEIRRSRSRESHREGRTRGPNRHEQHTPRTGRFAEQNLAAVGLAGRTPWWGHGAAVRGDPSAPDLPDTRVIGRQPAASCGVLPSSSGPRAAPVGATTPPNCSEAPRGLCRPMPMPDRDPGLEKVEILTCDTRTHDRQNWFQQTTPTRARACRTRRSCHAPHARQITRAIENKILTFARTLCGHVPRALNKGTHAPRATNVPDMSPG